MSISFEEFKKIEDIVSKVVQPMGEDLKDVKEHMTSVVDNMDQFLRIVQRHEQEWLVIRVQHQKMRDLLVKKGIATEEELSIA